MMSKKTIAKICSFVISCIFASSCGFVSSKPVEPIATSPYAGPVVVGRIKSKNLTDSISIADSKCKTDVIWSHNDSGNDETLLAISTDGTLIGEWKVAGAKNTDWEDIASYKDKTGKCYLFIGDTGDN